MSDNAPPPPPYSAPPPDPSSASPYDTPQQPTGGSGLAIGALVVGILSVPAGFTIFGGFILGLVAVILGIVAANKAKKGTATGRGMAIGGIVLGVIGILIAIALIVVAALFVNSDSGKNLTDCLQKAGDSQAAQQKCQDDFRQNFGN